MAVSIITVPPGTVEADFPLLLGQPAETLRRGGLVAFPTETVYGLGVDALNQHAVRRVFIAKGRPADNPLIVHLPDQTWIDRVVSDFTPLARDLADRFWPGPLTLVLAARPDVPSATTAGLGTVAVRIPDSALARTLIGLAGTPVAAPSANVSGRPSPTTAAHVHADLSDRIDWIIDGGRCAVGIESTVIDARGTRPVILREGGITREMLGVDDAEPGDPARSPGTRHSHYQPMARVVIAPAGRSVRTANALADRGSVGLVGPDDDGVDPRVTLLSCPIGAEELAAVLYGSLREADARHLDLIVVEEVPTTGVGRAVMDRLHRARGQDLA
ncbi:MAG: L-threonylcarbamoyladenylate synthase [Euzebya sp.]